MDPAPTFSTWKDRATYLAAEYSVPLSISIAGMGLWALWAFESVPTPPAWMGNMVLTWGLLALPTYVIGKRIVEWLYDPPRVTVAEARPGNEVIHRTWEIHPELWNEAEKMDDADPMPCDSGADYVVTELEFLEDVGELRVRGCEPEMLNTGDAFAYHEKVDRYYDQHIDLLAAYSRLKAVVAELIQDGHDDGLMQAIAARDKALAPEVSARDLLEEVEREGELADPGEILEWEQAEPEGENAQNGEGELIPEEAIADL